MIRNVSVFGNKQGVQYLLVLFKMRDLLEKFALGQVFAFSSGFLLFDNIIKEFL